MNLLPWILLLNLLLGGLGLYFAVTALWGLKREQPYGKFPPRYRFAVLIAARNEERVIADPVRSLLAQDYPRELFDVYVIPNNCTDHTAREAFLAGARLLEPKGPVRYKGDALRQGTDRLLPTGRYDAFCVFDADNRVHPRFLAEMNNALCSGAVVARGQNRSKAPGGSWVSACYALYFELFNLCFARARANLGLSANLIGTGFAVRASFLRELGGFRTGSITEDVEFLAQCAAAGERVWWVPEAVTYDEDPTSFRQSLHQRRRWCSGSMEVARRYLPRLWERFRRAPRLREADLMLFFAGPFVQAASVLPLLLSLLWGLLPGGPGMAAVIHISLLWLAAGWAGATLLALALAVRSGYPPRTLWGGVLMFGVFLVSWLPLQLAGLVHPATRWREIPHGLRPARQPAA